MACKIKIAFLYFLYFIDFFFCVKMLELAKWQREPQLICPTGLRKRMKVATPATLCPNPMVLEMHLTNIQLLLQRWLKKETF